MQHLSRKVVLVVAAIAAAVMPLASQGTAPKPSFKPVVIKPASYGQSVKKLVTYAYGVHDFQIVGGPDWVSTDLWDIQSKAEDANDHAPEPLIVYATQPDPFSLMVQSILEDRFRLKAHREVRQLPVYELVVAQGGLKMGLADDQTPVDLRAATPPVPTGFDRVRRGSYFIGGNRAGMGFEGNAIPLDWLMNILTIETGRTVIDKTGLHGLYDMQMEWTPDSARIPLKTAIEEELGLRLVSARGPVEVLVIDSVQKPSEN